MKPTENMGADFNQGANFAYVKTSANAARPKKINGLQRSKHMTETR
jgi:hypothetical protein